MKNRELKSLRVKIDKKKMVRGVLVEPRKISETFKLSIEEIFLEKKYTKKKLMRSKQHKLTKEL